MYNECRHLFISGKKCGSPALKEQNFCFYHTTARKREKHAADNLPYDRVNPKNTALALHTLDEGDAIQLAISEVVLALAANTIDSRRARILLYGLQIASQHYRTQQWKPAAGLREHEDITRETFQQEDGVEIGPEKQTPDPQDLPEGEQRLTLGRYLLLEAIKDGHIDPDEVPRKEQEWKELQQRQKGFHIQAVADDQPRCRRNRGRRETRVRSLEYEGIISLDTLARPLLPMR